MKLLIDMGFGNLEKLNGFHNEVFLGTLNNEKVIIRVSREGKKTYEEVMSEIRFIEEVSHNVNVTEPYYVDEKCVFKKGDRVVTLFKYIEGSNWRECEHTDSIIYKAGVNLAKIHDTSVNIKSIYNRKDFKKHNDIELFLSNFQEEKYKYEYVETIKEIERTANESDYFLIHGDYLFSNIIYNDELTVIDFDDCEYGYYQYDIAVYMFYYLLGGNPENMDMKLNRNRLKIFLEGYNTIRETNIKCLEDLNPFFRLRQLKLLGTIAEYSKGKLGEWQKSYVEVSLDRINGDKPFVLGLK